MLQFDEKSTSNVLRLCLYIEVARASKEHLWPKDNTGVSTFKVDQVDFGTLLNKHGVCTYALQVLP